MQVRATSYIRALMDSKARKMIVGYARNDLAPHFDKFDAFVGSSESGIIIASILAQAFDKELLIIRKSREGTHADHIEEGVIKARYVFVDDLISSGNTFKRVEFAVQSVEGEIYGIWLYSSFRMSPELVTSNIFEGKKYPVLNDDHYSDQVIFGLPIA